MKKSKTVNNHSTTPKKVAVIGLGYVGLPVACLAVAKGFDVVGIDINQARVNDINSGKTNINEEIVQEVVSNRKLRATSSYDELSSADVIIICVLTWIDERNKPRYDAIQNVSKTLTRYLRKGQLIVIESTIGPLVGDEIVIPTLETTGLKAGKDFSVAHCPERINPGDNRWTLVNIPRVIGANTAKDANIAQKFYTSLVEAPVTIVGTLKEASAVKVMENTFRDANIAIVNEFAKSFDALGIDVVKVINGASTKPFAFLAHYPSFGIGGYCIPTVPYYLLDAAKKSGFNHQLLKQARSINSTMPSYAVNKLENGLKKVGKKLKGSKVALLGLSYKGNLGEPRDSAALVARDLLKERGAKLVQYDPFIPSQSDVKSLKQAVQNVDAIFVATDHNEFKKLNNGILKQTSVKVILDGKNFLNKDRINALGIMYQGIGR